MSKYVNAQNAAKDAYEKKYLDTKTIQRFPYRILFPKKYKKNKKYPLILFLHGAGERGNDNELQLVHGATLFLDKKNRRKYKSIVVFPQCPKEDFWAHMEPQEDKTRVFPDKPEPTAALSATMELLDYLIKEEQVDEDQIYVMGLSMGGMGTFEILTRMPNRFAAAVPICGGGNKDLAPRYASKLALWIFHGGKDNVVFPEYSRTMHSTLKELGATVKYTEYPEANHNSWDPAFAEPELLSWLFKHRKP